MLKRLLDLADRLPHPALDEDAQLAVHAPAGGDHAIGLGQRHGRRLLAKHVLAGLGCGQHRLGVAIVGRDDVDHLHVGIGQHAGKLGVGLCVRGELACQLLGPLSLDVADGDQLGLP